MGDFSVQLRKTATYQVIRLISRQMSDFLETLGNAMQKFLEVLYFIIRGEFSRREVLEQCARFGVSSLPITLSIVGMSAIIVAMQVAGEMVKQGAGNYIGMLVSILIVREDAAIMSGFAIISMIGSSLASEVATMRVTEQIDAMTALKVNPVKYLFVPRVLSGIIMMPFVVVLAGTIGIIGGAVASNIAGGLSFRAYFESVQWGIFIKDIKVCLIKAMFFGGTISTISCTCGYFAKGGAKGVGLATTKAVVWSLVAIAVWDLLFAMAFFF